MNLRQEFDNFLKTSGVLERGYQGTGWDGNNSNQILKSLDELESVVLSEVPGLVPMVQCIKDFKAVKDSCFGQTFEPRYQQAIIKFKNLFYLFKKLGIILEKNSQ